MVNGFITYSLAPASMALTICGISLSVVTIIAPHRGEARVLLQGGLNSSRPFISGMFQSIERERGVRMTIEMGQRRRARARPPTTSSNPISRRICLRIMRIARESSTTSTFMSVRLVAPSRHPCRFDIPRPPLLI